MKKTFKVLLVALGVLVFVLLAAFLAVFLFSSGTYDVPETVAENPRLPGIELNGYKFHGETFGDPLNPPVIILHGGPGADYRYLYPLKVLADRYFLVFYDQRGTGLSPRVPAGGITLERYAADVDAFVDHFGKGSPVHIIGHSWGAMLASLYAGRYPRKVGGLVLAEPGFLKTDDLEKTAKGPSVGLFLKAGWAMAQSMHIPDKHDEHVRKDFVYSKILEGMNREVFHVRRPLEHWRAGYAVFGNLSLKMMKDPAFRKSLDFAPGAGNFKNEVLFLAGELSAISGPALQREHAKLFPRSRVVVIKGAGHYMFNENLEECAAVIRDYLGKL